MSSEPAVIIRLDDERPVYRPGETLSGQYRIESLPSDQVKAVEVSVLWHTDGKGDEDMAVHEFWRRNADDGLPIDPGRPQGFCTTLPNSPLTYQGQLVNLRWCVRVRAFPYRGKEVFGEKAFQLGDVSPVKAHSS